VNEHPPLLLHKFSLNFYIFSMTSVVFIRPVRETASTLNFPLFSMLQLEIEVYITRIPSLPGQGSSSCKVMNGSSFEMILCEGAMCSNRESRFGKETSRSYLEGQGREGIDMITRDFDCYA
jgi:hypothetical protein